MHLLWKFPVVLPVALTAWNIFFIVLSFLLEGRVKPQVLLYIFFYASTIRPALEGDLQPFIVVFQSG